MALVLERYSRHLFVVWSVIILDLVIFMSKGFGNKKWNNKAFIDTLVKLLWGTDKVL